MTRVFDELGWVDVYRSLYPKHTGEAYTWWCNRGQAWAKNVGWRIDYQIATPGIAAKAHVGQRLQGPALFRPCAADRRLRLRLTIDPQPRAPWLNALKVYTHPRVVGMLFLGFSAGLPLLLVLGTLSFWLSRGGHRARDDRPS